MIAKKIINIRILERIAKADLNDKLGKLIERYKAGAITEKEMEKELAEIFGKENQIKQYNDVFREIMRQARIAWTPAKEITPIQQEALTETLYQRTQNLLNLSDYKKRGTKYVQVRAVLDSRTTEHCKQMNGRIFAVQELGKSANSQVKLVPEESEWEQNNYFKGVATSEMFPALPPYHYNCRTRIVPYPYGEQYENFDKMQAEEALYPTILQDKFMNYELENKHYTEIRKLVERSEWEEKGLRSHFLKHNQEFGYKYETEQAYNQGAHHLLTDKKAGQALIYSLKNNNLCFMVWEEDIDSKSGSNYVVIVDLINQKILTYHKKRKKQIEDELSGENTIKAMVLQEPVKKKETETKMKTDKEIIPEEELKALIEEGAIGFYGILIDYIKKEYYVSLFEVYDAIDYRDEVIQQAYERGFLSEEQMREVKRIDDYILQHKVPIELAKFKEWLKEHQMKQRAEGGGEK